jgi:hypothetical protein
LVNLSRPSKSLINGLFPLPRKTVEGLICLAIAFVVLAVQRRLQLRAIEREIREMPFLVRQLGTRYPQYIQFENLPPVADW